MGARWPWRLAAVLLLGCAAPAPVAPEDARIVVDVSEALDLARWGEEVQELCGAWYPRTCRELWSEGFTPYARVKIVLRQDLAFPAATAADTIRVSAPHVRSVTGDEGMLIHELVHVVQRYPSNPGMDWLTEGIADYVRFWLYEPHTPRPPIDPQTASYRDGYRTAAAFLVWLARTRDPEIVAKLNARMRRGDCDPVAFAELLGEDLDELWSGFLAAGPPTQQ